MKIFAIDKETSERSEVSDLYFFEENFCHTFDDSCEYMFEFMIEPDDNVTYVIKTVLSNIGNIVTSDEKFNMQYLINPLFKAVIDFIVNDINTRNSLDMRDIIDIISQLVDISADLTHKLIKYEQSTFQPCIDNIMKKLDSPPVFAIKQYTLYHVTPTRNVASIITYGLQPKIGSRSEKANEIIPAIYLFTTTDEATYGLANWLGDEFLESEDCALLEVTVDSYFKRNAYEGVVFTTIEPANIKVLKTNI